MTQRNLIAANRARMLMVISLLALLVSTSIAKPAILTSIVRHDSTASTYSFFGQCGAPSGLDIEPDALELMMLQQPNATNYKIASNVSSTQAEPYPKPGLGKVTPFVTVMKDGFRKVKCMKDYMYYHSDKFGPNKHQYDNGGKAAVSIVLYDSIIKSAADAYPKKSKREPMTTKVCFDFCRTVPNMQYFGLVNGKNCYCTPYYQEMGGDKRFRKCDMKCPGDVKSMCGGMEKSSLYSMHKCDHMGKDLEAMRHQVNNFQNVNLDVKIGKARHLATDLKATAASLYSKFGIVADAEAMKLMEGAQKFADKITRKVEGAHQLSETMAWQVKATGKVKALTEPDGSAKHWHYKDFSSAKVLTAAESWLDETQKQLDSGATFSAELDALIALAENLKDVKGSTKQYTPVMHFVKTSVAGTALNGKQFEALPSVCKGDLVKTAVVAHSTDSCASACDAADLGRGNTCVGFQYFEDPKMAAGAAPAPAGVAPPPAPAPAGSPAGAVWHSGMVWNPLVAHSGPICFLFSKFKTVTYYTKCGINTTAAKPASFLELRRESSDLSEESKSSAAPFEVMCYTKFLKFTQKLVTAPTAHAVNFCY